MNKNIFRYVTFAKKKKNKQKINTRKKIKKTKKYKKKTKNKKQLINEIIQSIENKTCHSKKIYKKRET